MSKIMTTATLVRLNLMGRRRGYNRLLSQKAVEALDPAGVHVVHSAFPHGDADYMRVVFFAKLRDSGSPAELTLDMSWQDYEKLKEYEEPAEVKPAS